MEVKFVRATREQLSKRWKTVEDGSIIVSTDVPRMYVKMDGKLLPMTNPIYPQMIPRTCPKCGAALPAQPDNEFSVLITCEYCHTTFDVDVPILKGPEEDVSKEK